jgi:hypothetical protein
MSTTDELKAIRAAKEAATKLAGSEQALRERHDNLVETRRTIFNGSRSRAEVIANAERLVDDEHAAWWQLHGGGWARSLSGHHEARGAGPGTFLGRERIVKVPPRLPTIEGTLQAPGALTLRDLCALAPAIVKASLADKLTAMPDDRFGLSEADRTAKLAELDAAIADVEARHSELVDAAAEVGIALPLLATVKERREEQARHEERERLRAVERAAS